MSSAETFHFPGVFQSLSLKNSLLEALGYRAG